MLSVALQHLSFPQLALFLTPPVEPSTSTPDDAVRLPFLPSNLTAFQGDEQLDEWMHVLGVTQNRRPPLHLFCGR